MIDPFFERRLANWGRVCRSSRPVGRSSIASVMDELRLQHGAPADAEEPSAPTGESSPPDQIDAARLNAAYAGPWLTGKEKEVLRLRYACGKSLMVCQRILRVNSRRFFVSQLEAVVRKFQGIVEERFDKNADTP